MESLFSSGKENRPEWFVASARTLRQGMVADITTSETVRIILESLMVFLLVVGRCVLSQNESVFHSQTERVTQE